jgi:hypothetical protein
LGDDRIIAVVLSNATEVHDRGAGWHASQDIVTLQEYLLVDQRLALVERYWRRDGHSWWYRSYEAGETVTLSTGHVLSIDALYDGVLDLPGEVAELRETLTEASDRLLAVAAWLRERAK